MPHAGEASSPDRGTGGSDVSLDTSLARALFEHAVDGIIIINEHGIIESANPAVQTLLGYEPSTLIGRSVNLLMFHDDAAAHDGHIRRYLQTGEAKVIGTGREVVARRSDGTAVTVHLSISELHIESRRTFAGVLHDVSDRVRNEEMLRRRANELQVAKEEAEVANRAKDQFLAVLSHELRTPLTPALAILSGFAAEDSLTPELRDALQIIRRNVELEARLIDDLLDLTRVARGKLQLRLETIDIHAAIRDTLQMCQSDIGSRSLVLRSNLEAKHHYVMADPARFRQVIWNLLKNAIKFTPLEGQITISTLDRTDSLPPQAFPEDSVIAGQSVAIQVRDTGIGIEREAISRIFNAFEQGSPTITRQFGGLGLGLAISRAVAALHGGRLTADSEGLGKGAVFTLELHAVHPARRVEQPRQTGNPITQRKLSVLLVDDHPDTVRAMRLLLAKLGHNVNTATTVNEARKLLKGHNYDVLVSDIGLPDGSGLDLMRDTRQRQNVAGIALSGYGMEEDIRRSLEAGFVEHLTKPVDFPTLRNAVERVATKPVISSKTRRT